MPLSLAALLACAACPVFASARDTVSVNLPPASAPALAASIATNFASFSYEVDCGLPMLTFGGGPRPSFVALMRELQSVSGGAGPNLRIGGNSADKSAWLPAPAPLPRNDTYRITPADVAAYLAAVPLWNGSITPGVNFRDAADAALAVAHVQGLTAGIPWSSPLIEAIEVGNECDLYTENGIRAPSFTFAEYLPQFGAYVSALTAQAGLPPARIQGGTFCCHRGDFDAGIDTILSSFTSELASFSYHHYPLSHCHGSSPTLSQLLADDASTKGVHELAPFAADAAKRGIPFFIGEGNSVSCGGTKGVSDVFGATLWAVDVLFNAAAAGISRWNFHGCPEGAYTAVAYPSPTTSDVPDVRPLFYGIWLFTQATAHRASTYAPAVTTSNPLIKVHASRDGGGVWRVVLIHKDASAGVGAARVTVAAPAGAAGAASLLRMAPTSGGASAHSGIYLSGLTFDNSTDGRPVGTLVPEAVPLAAGGYAFDLDAASLVLLTLPPV